MDTQQVWSVLGQIPVGHIIAWGAAICSVLVTLYKTISKAYAFFTKYKQIKDENERQSRLIDEHDKLLQEIKKSLDEQRDVNLKQIRHELVHTCDDALSIGYISAWKLRSLEEMYEEYRIVFNGNGYVRTLIEKTRSLPVHGTLDG